MQGSPLNRKAPDGQVEQASLPTVAKLPPGQELGTDTTHMRTDTVPGTLCLPGGQGRQLSGLLLPRNGW